MAYQLRLQNWFMLLILHVCPSLWVKYPVPVAVSGQLIQNGIHFNQRDSHKHDHHHHYKSPAAAAPRAKLKTDLGWIQENLERHNYYRELHGAPPLKLNYTLCEISQAWANQRAQGRIGHNPEKGWLGENIYTTGVRGYPLVLNGSHPVDLWYKEIKDYNYGTCSSIDKKVIGHFTQVVWEGSKEMGVATTFYQTSEPDGRWDYMVVVANYYPPGNIPGIYDQNVKPKMSTSSCVELPKLVHLLIILLMSLLSC